MRCRGPRWWMMTMIIFSECANWFERFSYWKANVRTPVGDSITSLTYTTHCTADDAMTRTQMRHHYPLCCCLSLANMPRSLRSSSVHWSCLIGWQRKLSQAPTCTYTVTPSVVCRLSQTYLVDSQHHHTLNFPTQSYFFGARSRRDVLLSHTRTSVLSMDDRRWDVDADAHTIRRPWKHVLWLSGYLTRCGGLCGLPRDESLLVDTAFALGGATIIDDVISFWLALVRPESDTFFTKWGKISFLLLTEWQRQYHL